MSDILTIPDCINSLAMLVSAGEIKKARSLARTLLDVADPNALQVVGNCVRILETHPNIAVIKLRAYWQSCTSDADRAIIAACAPKDGQSPHRTQTEPDRTPKWNRRNKHEAPRDERRQVRPELRRRRDVRQARDNERAAALVTTYDRDRAGVEESQPQRGERRTRFDAIPQPPQRPIAYAHDYDKDAVARLRGTPCVYCWLERAEDEYTSTSDDGLCTDCRQKRRPGIPVLPAGHTRADAINARCAHIAARHHATTARAILRNEWHRAQSARDRATIAAWVQANSAAIDAPAQSARAEVSAPCATCGSVRQIRDGQCADCRELHTEPAPVSESAIDTADTGQVHAAA